jgi:hypothetical protein
VSDETEQPAVPPEDVGGDERAGYILGGALLLALGFGVGVVGNVLAHQYAGPGGSKILLWSVSTTMGPYAWTVVALGLVAGVLGIALLAIGRSAPKGPLQLPGFAY